MDKPAPSLAESGIYTAEPISTAAPLSSAATKSTKSPFPKFGELVANIRLLIWEHAIPAGLMVNFNRKSVLPVPSILHASRESREVALAVFTLVPKLLRKAGRSSSESMAYINLELDTFCYIDTWGTTRFHDVDRFIRQCLPFNPQRLLVPFDAWENFEHQLLRSNPPSRRGFILCDEEIRENKSLRSITAAIFRGPKQKPMPEFTEGTFDICSATDTDLNHWLVVFYMESFEKIRRKFSWREDINLRLVSLVLK